MNDPLTKPAVQSAPPAAGEAASPAERCPAGPGRRAKDLVRPEDVVRCVSEIAFSRPNDAVALACGQRGRVEAMDEVKFVDRLRALELLWTLLGGSGGGDGAARDFLQALEDAGAGSAGGEGRR